MPDAYDDFKLTVEKSVAADIKSSTNDDVGSGDAFTISFQYRGGINPAATGFEVDWYANSTDRGIGQNALSGSQIPTNVTFSPRTPNAGGTYVSGQLSGTAPVLGQSESRRELYGKLTILQGALNA